MRIESIALAAVATALLMLTGCAGGKVETVKVNSPYNDYSQVKEGDIVHLPTGRPLAEEELYDYLGAHRVIYVGESHDSVEDHTVQLKVLKNLYARFPGKVALGMEMLRTDGQETADKWWKGELDEKEVVRFWNKQWGNTWPYYAEIMRFARDNKIPVVAMNRPKPPMPASHKMGMAEEKTAEPAKPVDTPPEPEIDYADPYYEEYISAFFAGHDAGPEIRKKFMKGQLLWDETMAQTGAEYLKKPENADKKLIVLAGGNHVRYGFGVPRRLFRRLPAAYTVLETHVLHFPEEKRDKLMEVNLPDLPLPIADTVWMVNYSDLEDKIIRLGIAIKDAEEGGGVLVADVFPESSAEKAGIKKDDVITGVDGVELKEMFDLTYELSKKTKGEKGKVELKRGGEKLTVEVTWSPTKHK